MFETSLMRIPQVSTTCQLWVVLFPSDIHEMMISMGAIVLLVDITDFRLSVNYW